MSDNNAFVLMCVCLVALFGTCRVCDAYESTHKPFLKIVPCE